MPRPCGHKCDEEGCFFCDLSRRNPAYRTLWDGNSRGAVTSTSCVHLGGPNGDTVACPSCPRSKKSRVQVKLFRCAVYGECTVGRKAEGVACCVGCPDKKLPPAPEEIPGGKIPLTAATEASSIVVNSSAPSLSWAYGVTTVPERRETTLPTTLESLHASGFASPRIFVDGGDADAYSPAYAVTARHPRVGAYGNWVLSLWELYVRNPGADRFVLFQDDLVCSLNLRAYLERTPYPEKGYLNLYTFPRNQILAKEGKVGFYPSDQMGKGALALVFSREVLQALLCQPHLVQKANAGSVVYRTRSIDGGVVDSLRPLGIREYVHNPSLVQHTGTMSTLGNGPHPLAESFKGEGFDLLELIA